MLGTHIFKVQKLGRRTNREKLIITLYDPIDFRKFNQGNLWLVKFMMLKPTSPGVAELVINTMKQGVRTPTVVAIVEVDTLWTSIEKFLTALKTENIINKWECNNPTVQKEDISYE